MDPLEGVVLKEATLKVVVLEVVALREVVPERKPQKEDPHGVAVLKDSIRQVAKAQEVVF